MCLDFTFKVGVSFPFILLSDIVCLLYQSMKVLCVKLERGALRQRASQEKKKNPLLFFLLFFLISLDRISDAKINHQVNISSNTTFARTSRKYSFDAKLCMRLQWSDVAWGGWLTGWRQLRVFKTLLAPPAYLTACSHEEATWTHTSTAAAAAAALPAVSASRVWDWFCVTRFPLCNPTQPLAVACSIQI